MTIGTNLSESVKALILIEGFLFRSKDETSMNRLNHSTSKLKTIKVKSQKLKAIRRERRAKLEIRKNHDLMLKGSQSIAHKTQC